MEDKKRVTVLIIIALVLAVTAIVLNNMDSNEIPISKPMENSGGKIGVEIQPSPVEDKLANEASNNNHE